VPLYVFLPVSHAIVTSAVVGVHILPNLWSVARHSAEKGSTADSMEPHREISFDKISFDKISFDKISFDKISFDKVLASKQYILVYPAISRGKISLPRT
jgi:hypothetical protein